MFEKLRVNAWVNVQRNCAMRAVVTDSDSAFFVFGDNAESFEFVFDAETLRRFVTVATDGLREMAEREIREEASVVSFN